MQDVAGAEGAETPRLCRGRGGSGGGRSKPPPGKEEFIIFISILHRIRIRTLRASRSMLTKVDTFGPRDLSHVRASRAMMVYSVRASRARIEH